jgi:uncharacterized Zn-finger protein
MSLKKFNCDICDKSFSHNCSLANHLRIHSGERPYKCHICDKSFVQSGHLTSHLIIHSGERPYKCDICDKSFGQSGHLTIHLRIHSGEKPYKCDICDKSFSKRWSLTSHLRIHSGEKPYKCDICDKSFGQSGSLTIHLRIHSGEKPYKCDICDKSFSQRGHFSTHLKICTGESKLTHPETLVQKALELFELSFETQKKFTGLRYKNPLAFDFYIPDLQAVIEYDGVFHYKAIHGEEKFKTGQLRDRIKDDYCELNDIPILRIPYWKKDSIEYLVFEFIERITHDF